MNAVFITGASGFIGSEVVETFLKHGFHVYALFHRGVNTRLKALSKNSNLILVQGDVADLQTLTPILKQVFTEKIEAIVHCAGYASDVGKRSNFKKLNYESVLNMAHLLATFNIRKLIFVSTTDVYGLKDFSGEDEEALPYETRPINPYPEFKIQAEKWLKEHLSKERYVIVRPAAVWGLNDQTLTQRIAKFLKTSPFIVHFGKWKGKNRWPLAHVKNVANAIYYSTVTDTMDGKAINVIDDENISIDQFYKAIAGVYFPTKTYRTIVLPMWLGQIISFFVTQISNVFNLTHPFMDPSLYALYSVSAHLDFSNKRLKFLLNSQQCELIDFEKGCQELKDHEGKS